MTKEIQFLNESPIYAMSLGSKELFHSNFWQWIMTCENIKPKNAFVKVFFDVQKVEKIEREQQHRDLTVWTDEGAYVIENKIKSVPYKEQLVEYETKLDKNFKGGIVTGIFKPDFLDDKDCKNWKFLSYEQIGKKILEILKTVKCSKLCRSIIEEYAKIVLSINAVIQEKLKDTEKLMQNKDCKDLEQIRLDDICKKYNAEQFASYLTQTLQKDLLSLLKDKPQCRLSISCGFSRKSSFNDVRIFVNEADERKKWELGIQIQDGQYRKSAVRCGKIDNKKLFEEFKQKGWFSPINKVGKQKYIDGKSTNLRKKDEFCIFEKDYHFVYQYWNIEDYSFETLSNQIREDMEKAIDIVNDTIAQEN